MFVRTAEERNKCNMNKETVFLADFKRDLSYRLKKRLALDIADCAADLGDNHICVCLFTYTVNKILDLVGDMGNYLNR